jgi:hypothetical protein
MVDHNKNLQLGKFIAWTGMLSTTKWHICIGFWCNLHTHTKSEIKSEKKKFLGHKPKINYHVYSYLKSCRIKFLRITEIFWIVMNVPEQRHHLPTFRNQVPCHKVRCESLSLNVNFYDKCWKNCGQIQYKLNWPLHLSRIIYSFNLAFALRILKIQSNLTTPSEQDA